MSGRIWFPLLHMPDVHPLLDADYKPYDVGVMGELDVRILTELFGGARCGGPCSHPSGGVGSTTRCRAGRR